MKNKNSICFTDEKYHFGKCLFVPIFKVFPATTLLLFFLSIYDYSYQFLNRIFVYLYHLFSNNIKPDFYFKEQICSNASMCPVLHMARCTNVPTFELARHSKVVRVVEEH